MLVTVLELTSTISYEKNAVTSTSKNSNIPMTTRPFGIQKWKDFHYLEEDKIRISVGWSSVVGGGFFRKVHTWWWLPGKLDGAGGIKVGPLGYHTQNQLLLPLAEAKEEKNRNTKRRPEVPTHNGEFRSSLNTVYLKFIWCLFVRNLILFCVFAEFLLQI